MNKILVVEDEVNIRDFIVLNLKMSLFEPIEAEDGNDALIVVEKEKVDLVLLDLNIPGKSGFDVCKAIKENYPDIAVIMVTAKGQDIDKIIGLELGADDYIVKPFNPLELIARIRSVLRRFQKPINTPQIDKIIIDDLNINIAKRIVIKNNSEVKLKPKEFELLAFLIQHPDSIFSRDDLLNFVWGKDFFGEVKTIDVHIRRIREKIEQDPGNPKYIETVWGIGYRWRVK